MKVTTKMLQAKDACTNVVAIFKTEWPDGVTVSLKVIKRATELRLDLDWFADNFLSTPQLAEYETKRDSLLAEYEAKRDSLLWETIKNEKARI